MIDPGISRPLRTLVAVLVVALLGACGGTAASVPAASPSVQPPASQSPAASSLPEGVVAVTLSEMNLVVSDTSAPPGEVVFEVKNSGELPHEVVVIRTDTDAADLPMEGVQVIEDGLDIVARTDRIPAGDRATLATELEPGHYVLICNISGHYEQSQYGPGMKADFEVR